MNAKRSSTVRGIDVPSLGSRLNPDIQAYNAAQKGEARAVCEALAERIVAGLRGAENKVWHGGPVWFLEGNPIVGYWVRKTGVELLFWSGQSFAAPGLQAAGKFKAARVEITDAKQVQARAIGRWLREARSIQWDYKNIVKRRGVLVKLGSW